MIWKDSTSYRQGSDVQKPTVWSADVSDLRITVVFGHLYYPNQWVMHCHKLGLDTLPVKAESAEEAQRIALELVRKQVRVWLEALQGAGD